MKEEIKYECKDCGWKTSIRAEWSDMRPKKCMAKKCNTSFRANPNKLKVVKPEKKTKTFSSKKDSSDEKKSSYKSKRGRKAFKQQEESKNS